MSGVAQLPSETQPDFAAPSQHSVAHRRPDHDGRWPRRFFWFNIAAIMVVAVVMRCRDLGHVPGVNGDEAWYGVQVELLLSGRSTSAVTPTGNLLNPFFFGPQLLLHSLFGASFALLRTTSVLTCLAALALNYWLCKPIFGRRIALVSTLILAVLPINIAYSRLAWDTTQTVLITLPALYWPLRAVVDARRKTRWSLLGLAAFGAALVVHPTNVFVGGIVAACLGYAWRRELRTWWGGDAEASGCDNCANRRALSRGVRLRRIATLLIAGGIGLAGVWVLWPRLDAAALRAVDLRQYASFALDFGHLFNGATVYQYISGSMAEVEGPRVLWELLPLDVLTWLVIAWFGWGLRRRLAKRRPVEICVAAGGAVSLAAFFLIAGSGGIAANVERYSLWLIGPAALLAALACDTWFDGSRRRWAAIGGVSLAWLLLFTFQCNYFECFYWTGGDGHRTYRTGNVEPKQAALDYIVRHSPPGLYCRVLTSEWWNYWPLRYLSLATRSSPLHSGNPLSSQIVVESWEASRGLDGLSGSDVRSFGPLYLVEFTASNTAATIRRWGADNGREIQEVQINDAADRPLLSVFAVPGPISRAAPAAAQAFGGGHASGGSLQKN